ncbi:putative bifunctional diguanylate cyclase/phosphodiesterase [Halioxenophilus sp. WMMB6]|uniref:putative bifunctional diguanylate cyclase/phosphodiesterase n=1 Tax=Halioxenophilus sp. WMMB6 TaxID=3073815 RepID=UPI00295E54CA|nr:EAL domain-containing protein [Halioxenophilus sp. WMMB6]
METDIQLLVVTPNRWEFDRIQESLAKHGRYTCHWHERLAGVESQVASGDYHLVLLQFHWQHKTTQMLLYRLQSQPLPPPVVVFTEMLEKDVDQQVISVGAAADYFNLDTLVAEHLERILRYALVRQNYEQRLARQAHYDELCGIANRSLFQDRLNRAIHSSRRNRERFALLFIDLDHFKRINDSHGHSVGDAVLRGCAKRLSTGLRQSDSLARISGDEFTVLIERVDSNHNLEQLANKLIRQIQQPLVLEGLTLTPSCSMGIAIYPDVGDDSETLLHCADAAMNEAKKQGGNSFVIHQLKFEPSNDSQLLHHHDLLRALQREEFCLRFQPRVEIASGQIVAVEALLRWSHPERGLLAPADFFPLAEKKGLLPSLGYWVLREAISQWQRLNEELEQPIRLAVNLVGAMLCEVRLIDRLRQLQADIGRAGLAGLELEVRQADWLQHGSALSALTMATNTMGVRFSLDGVGRGTLPLADLADDTIASLVINRELVSEVDINPKAVRMIEAITELGRVLNKVTVAQGVENLQQLRLLQATGCSQVQGYFTASPLRAADLRTHLLQQRLGRLSMFS